MNIPTNSEAENSYAEISNVDILTSILVASENNTRENPILHRGNVFKELLDAVKNSYLFKL